MDTSSAYARHLCPTQATTRTLVIIDGNVTDYQTLADGILPGTDLLILDPSRDGIQQITECLRAYQMEDEEDREGGKAREVISSSSPSSSPPHPPNPPHPKPLRLPPRHRRRRS